MKGKIIVGVAQSGDDLVMLEGAASRQLALIALEDIYQNRAYTDIALDRVLREDLLQQRDKNLISELVYGAVRRKRTLDRLITQFGRKQAKQQPIKLRLILHLGLYQLRYLQQIPPSAAVNTSVELAKNNGLGKLAGVVNGILREYLRQAGQGDPLQLPSDAITRLGIAHSFPDWIVKIFRSQLTESETNQLCAWFNQPTQIHLRINPLKTSLPEVEQLLRDAQISFEKIACCPQALRLTSSVGRIDQLPNFERGWYSVQDSSAQLVSYLLDPQPGELIIDACAAPGGKTTHIAELMKDRGTIWAIDSSPQRLEKIEENARRLAITSIRTQLGDSSSIGRFLGQADGVLVDAPCSGLGTLQKRPDIRWRQKPSKIKELVQLQLKILTNAASWVKPGGRLVYSTCTLNPQENESAIGSFLENQNSWKVEPPSVNSPAYRFVNPQQMIKVFPHLEQMDGFFMVKLVKSN